MRIALFTETFLPKVDGIVTRLKHTVEHFQKAGDRVLIVTPEAGLREYQGAEVYGVPSFPFPLYPELKAALPRPEIGQKLQEFKPDIIHVVNPAIVGLGGIYYSKKFGIPLLASYHTHLPQYLHYYGLGILEDFLWTLLRLAHNQAELNLSPSSVMVEELRNHGIERVDLWPRAVDTEMFDPSLASLEMRKRLSQDHPEAPLLLYVGRLGAEKEIDRLKPILEAIPQARLALVGDGPHRQVLEEHFAGTATNFVGYLSGKTLATAYASADVFVFPSRTETLGLVILEAMAAGCPVVAARSGGIPDIVQDGVSGYLFDPTEEEGAITATKKLLSDPNQRETLRHNARAEAEKWGWAASTQAIREYYFQVLNKNHSP